jgi:thiol-disulfide isomerase/thioredoxin
MNQPHKLHKKQSESIILILLLSLLIFAGSVGTAASQKSDEQFAGKLNPSLVPDKSTLYGMLFKPVAGVSKYKFVPAIKSKSTVTIGNLYNPLTPGGKLEVILVEPLISGASYVCSDFNADGIIGENERAPLAVGKDDANDFEGTLDLPVQTPLFKNFPIFLQYKKGFKGGNMEAGDRMIRQSAYAFAVGHVEIKGKSTLVNYKFSPSASSVSANEGLFGVDVNGDGHIKNQAFSAESSYAYKEAPVFRIGNLYVSIDSIDLEKNLIVMRPRVAADYHRQELDIGTEMPDFAFVDFNGKKRRLGEFRKKYLLIDFWGLWCVDCRRELPYQLAAYKQFRSRGFEILGMNDDENAASVKEVLAKNGINWTQARLDSIKNLIEETYQIQEFPSAILLAPDGKVVVLDQHKLQGEELLKTLNQLLPK